MYSRCVDFKFLEDGKSFLIEFIGDGNVCNVWGVVVIQSVDVLHHTGAISFNGSQDQQVLKVPELAIIEAFMYLNLLKNKYLEMVENCISLPIYTNLCSLKTELSRTIFSNNSMSSLGRSAVMKAFTVTEISSGSWVSDRAVCTTYRHKINPSSRLITTADNKQRTASKILPSPLYGGDTHLVNQLSPELIVFIQHLGPQIHVSTLHQVAGLTLEQGVLIAHLQRGKIYTNIIYWGYY